MTKQLTTRTHAKIATEPTFYGLLAELNWKAIRQKRTRIIEQSFCLLSAINPINQAVQANNPLFEAETDDQTIDYADPRKNYDRTNIC